MRQAQDQIEGDDRSGSGSGALGNQDEGPGWCGVTGSNRRPTRCKRVALPTELTPHKKIRRWEDACSGDRCKSFRHKTRAPWGSFYPSSSPNSLSPASSKSTSRTLFFSRRASTSRRRISPTSLGALMALSVALGWLRSEVSRMT